MTDRGQLSHLLQQRRGADQNKREVSLKKQHDTDQSTMVIATITRGFEVKEMSAGYRKAQIRRLS